jgi:penicillin G amidase
MNMHIRRWLLWSAGGLSTAGLLVFAITWLALRASLAQLEGQHATTAVSSTVTVDRDALGIPTITGRNRNDLVYATGYLHAQERFFQMDLLRRSGAGELAELIGPRALGADRRNRLHRFRARAHAAVDDLPPDQRQILEKYSKGVNDGLSGLSGRPFEYWLLQATPAPWKPEDSLLAIYAMYFDLQRGEILNILSRGLLRELQPTPMVTFLLPRVTYWDAPLEHAKGPGTALPTPPVATPGWFRSSASPRQAAADWFQIPGSNSWAVSKTHGVRNVAIVANDMHLGLRLPNIWYRLSLAYPDARGHARRITGASLPGTPAVVVGSNGRVAWAFTNHFGGGLDLIELDRVASDNTRYAVSGGTEKARVFAERIMVKGEKPVELVVLETKWGPILEVGKRSYAVRWIAHDRPAVNLTLMRMEDADDVSAALSVGQASGIPSQNIIAGDVAGNIGWSIAGRLPRRTKSDDGFPVAAARYRPWSGHLAPHEHPSRVNPRLGRLWSANNRHLLGPDSEKIGDASRDMGARASQIRDALLARERFDEQALSAIQFDTKASWAEYWRRLMLESLDPAALAGHAERAELKRLLEQWNGRADVDAAGYLLVRSFYWSLYDAWFGGLNDQFYKSDIGTSDGYGGVGYHLASFAVPVVMEAIARQREWIPAPFSDWKTFMLDRVDEVIKRSTKNGTSLSQARWGDANRATIAHPFASLIPGLEGWLSAPPDALPGDVHMPLINRRGFGASQRMVVTPGQEESGLFQMPGGQSGHPLSPFFLAGHDAWVKGEPSPFLPGPSRYRFVIESTAAQR